MKKAKDSGESILNLLARKSKNKPSGKNSSLISNGTIEFTNVKFSYPLRPHITVLKGLNLSVKAGQFAGNSLLKLSNYSACW